MTCSHQFLFVHTLQLYKPLFHVTKKEAKVNEEANRSWLANISFWPRRSNERFDYVYATRCPREDKELKCKIFALGPENIRMVKAQNEFGQSKSLRY